jgi:hypothetical protein
MTTTPSNGDPKFPKGHKKVGGRKKGTPNKATATLKEAILLAASGAHKDGMTGYLTEQAKNNPAAFMTLLGKVLPTTLANDPTNPLPAPQWHVHPVSPKGE